MKNNLISAALLCSLSFNALAGKMSETIYSFYTVVDAGGFDKAVTYLADNLKATLPFAPQGLDKMGYKQLGMSMKTAFPDMQHKILETTEGKNTVAFQAWFSGTNTGSMMGNPPTGNRVETPFMGYFKFNKQGKISEVNLQFDAAAFNAQLMKGIDPKMVSEKNIRELFILMDAGKTDEFPGYCAADFKITNPFLPQPSPVQAFQGIIQTQKTAFPDMKHEVLEILSDGQNVVTKGIFKGTNTGSMMGNPPTGNRVELPFLVFDKLDAQGKLTSRFVQFDSKSFEAQLMKNINPHATAETSIRNMFVAADAGDSEKFMSFWADNGANYFAGKMTTQEDMKKRIPAFKAAFPDIKRVLEDVVVSGNTVTVRGWVTGTNKGKFMGNEPTGNSIKVHFLGFYKLNAAGKIEAGWVEFDTEALVSQVKGEGMGMKH
jgi:predicted ester cyclase